MKEIPLIKAACKGDLEAILIQLSKGTDPNKANDEGNTALHMSLTSEITEALIKNGADICGQNNEGYTPIHWARSVDIAKLLVDAGADVNAKSEHGFTPLHVNHNPEVIKYLVTIGADINCESDEGDTPLNWAQHANNPIAENIIRKLGGKTYEEIHFCWHHGILTHFFSLCKKLVVKR